MAKRILIIDDDVLTSEVMKHALEVEGYEIVTAPNGVEGLAKARDEKPDLVVLDVMLPGLDGYEVCHRLREAPQTADLPILMLSAKAREVDVETGRRMGANVFLTKPLDPSALVAQVGALLA
ncbi:MAG: response regulator [Anaerolineae bacterium]|nr:response regulator [Anaerolineae bacterium]